MGFKIHDEKKKRLPMAPWLRQKITSSMNAYKTEGIVKEYGLNTVCEEAKCPNRFQCYTQHTATFLALGKACTRACSFCEIDFDKNPAPLDPEEPNKIAQSISLLKLKHAVITMVARDDLEDGGALQIKKIVQAIYKKNPQITTEILTSDFHQNQDALRCVMSAAPSIFNHNIETTKDLTPKVRHKATYQGSLKVLSFVKNHYNNVFVKSGIMLGFGESIDSVKKTIQDLYNAGCDIITIGQYLQPSQKKIKLKEYVKPEVFDLLKVYGEDLGVPFMHTGPFIRSSYNAGAVLDQLLQKKRHP